MTRNFSLQARLGLWLGLLLTLLWLGAAYATSLILRQELDEVFDSALQEAAQRMLPLAVLDIVGREDDGVTQRLGVIREHAEYFTYVVRGKDGRILLQSHAADPALFPAYDGPGFRDTATHRIYNDDALKGTVSISVAEPLAHRASAAQELQWGLVLPLALVIPLALLAIVVTVRGSLAPLKRFREGLASRGARDLSPVPLAGLPPDIVPVASTFNTVLSRLQAAFDAERSFAANAAHELRTPLAGAIAQAQRLKRETTDAAARERAADIETTLKRLTRLSERLMQLARAEGGRLRMETASDLRIAARIVADDAGRAGAPGRVRLALPDAPVMSDLDPDLFGILCRNLIDNALRHGTADTPVDVSLTPKGRLTVSNDSAVVPADVLARLTQRFERGGAGTEGSGLGLAIAAAIAERLGTHLHLTSPRPGTGSGFEAAITLPVTGALAADQHAQQH